MTASLWALNLPNWPGDDGDNEVTPHQAEDQGAGEEEVEDGDPHPAHHQGEAEKGHLTAWKVWFNASWNFAESAELSFHLTTLLNKIKLC